MTLTKTQKGNRNVFEYGSAKWSESVDSNYDHGLLLRMAIFLSESLLPFGKLQAMTDDQLSEYLEVTPQDIKDLL